MARINEVQDILFAQMERLAVKDNFNRDDGTFDAEDLEQELKRTNAIIDITDTMLDITRTQLQVEKARCDLMLDKTVMPLMIGDDYAN